MVCAIEPATKWKRHVSSSGDRCVNNVLNATMKRSTVSLNSANTTLRTSSFGSEKTRPISRPKPYAFRSVTDHAHRGHQKGPQHLLKAIGRGQVARFQHRLPLVVERLQAAGENRPHQPLFRAEVVVDRRQVHPRLLGDRPQGGRRQAVLGKQALGSVQQALAGVDVLFRLGFAHDFATLNQTSVSNDCLDSSGRRTMCQHASRERDRRGDPLARYTPADPLARDPRERRRECHEKLFMSSPRLWPRLGKKTSWRPCW